MRLFIVGESPGEEEALQGTPFVGRSGQLLMKVLKEFDIAREDCYITNVFKMRPPDNNVDFFFMRKGESKKIGWDKKCPHPLFGTHGYVKEEYLEHLNELRGEIKNETPRTILALGATSLWALTGHDTIGSYRGTRCPCRLFSGPIIIPAYHPAAILRNWESLPLLYNDVSKALHTADSPPDRKIIIRPTIEDLWNFYNDHILQAKREEIPVTFDIETADDQITCIGFSVGNIAIVVPFYASNTKYHSYWKTFDEEVEAWNFVKAVIEDPSLIKVGHNASYDIQWLAAKFKIFIQGRLEDTMFMAHSLQPEMRKGLGVLASQMCDAPAWKQMVKHQSSENKKDA